MKTPVSFFLAVIFPFLASAQAQNIPSVKLRTLDERTVRLEEIFQDDDLALAFFFNENCRNLTDQFDYLENLAEEYQNSKLKIIAVYNVPNGHYGQVKPFLNGNGIDIETFIDVNGELQRALGLSVNSTILLSRFNNLVTGRFFESVSYTTEQADIELMQLLSGDYLNSYTNSYSNPYN